MSNLRDVDTGPLILAVLITAMVVVAIVAGLISSEQRRRRQAASLAAINFVRSSFASRLARGEPMDELLVQVADALLDSMHLDAAEVWLHEKGTLQLAARAPRDGP
ncbi:MAG TPA: hypothetical protein VHO95_07320, partial [Candidatus Dormibacteraeota bacterium]|nr:hypothetical protein [Candidatus Dormibacteraeota bacterium]